jgi:hypothetical protein
VDRIDVKETMNSLSEAAKKVLYIIPRLPKSKNNIFSEEKLKKKGLKKLRGVDLELVLKELTKKGLINPVKRKVWQTTSLGRKVSHELMKCEFEQTRRLLLK